MLVPLYGFLKGDTLGLIVLVDDHQPVRDIAACLQQAAAARVPQASHASVYFKGERLEPHLTVGQAGIEPLDRVDVVPEEDDGV